jgi:hypothetical protein
LWQAAAEVSFMARKQKKTAARRRRGGAVQIEKRKQTRVVTAKSGKKSAGNARATRRGTDVSPEIKIDIGPPNSRDTW